MRLATFPVPDVEESVASIVALWNQEIPGSGAWRRGPDQRLLDPERRYLRGDDGKAHMSGEHFLEYVVLHPVPADMPTFCLGSRLVDGVNAVPLATDAGGGRRGNVEADMLLLVREDAQGEYRLLLVEVKANSNNAWFAVVENLRQLRLFSESEETQRIFHDHRLPSLDLPQPLPVTGVVLAPEGFYTAPGAKAASVSPAQRLLSGMRAETGVDIRLASWPRAMNRVA